MNHLSLIGIGGFKRAGKDTLGNLLATLTGWRKIGMSDAIARATERQYSIERITDDMKDEPCASARLQGRTYRDLLIEVGAHARTVLPTWWTDCMAMQVHEAIHATRGAIVTGIRTPDEYRWIAANRGALVWVHRPGYESDGSDTEVDHHTECDVTIRNVDTLPALWDKAVTFLRAYDAPLIELPHTGRTLYTATGRTIAIPEGIDLGKVAGLDHAGRIVVDDFGNLAKPKAEWSPRDYLFGLTLCCNAHDKGVESGVVCRGCHRKTDTGRYLRRLADGTFQDLDPKVAIL